MKNQDGNNIIDQNRKKCSEVPTQLGKRTFSSDIIKKSDTELMEYWNLCSQDICKQDIRGWCHDIYKYQFAGKRILDIGSGIGIDGIFFAEHGAEVTFADIVQDNQELLKRICKLKNISANFYYIDNVEDFSLTHEYDAMLAIGSLHHIPFSLAQKEISELTKHLKVGGKFCFLAYPKGRYEYCESKDFAEFGRRTDGERTPWAEWYDDDKIQDLFGNKFNLNWSRNFGKFNNEFNWFELSKLRE